MQIQYLSGDVFDLAFSKGIKHIAHGVNCQGVMGSGFAKQVKELFPEVYAGYVALCQRAPDKSSLLGDAQVLRAAKGSDFVVINCFTQLGFGSDDARHVSYDAVSDCFRNLNKLDWVKEVIMPKIGAGLGGGSWEVIAAIIETESTSCRPFVAVPKGPIGLKAPKPSYVRTEKNTAIYEV